MMLDGLLNALFPAGHDTKVEPEGILCGTAQYGQDKTAAIVGLVNRHTTRDRRRAVACQPRTRGDPLLAQPSHRGVNRRAKSAHAPA